MGLCSGEEEDCPVLESTERVKTGRAKKYTSESFYQYHSFYFTLVCVFREVVWKGMEGCGAGAVQ